MNYLRKHISLLTITPFVIMLLLTMAFIMNRRSIFLPGKTSNGHYIFETSCNSCHVAFASVPDNKCIYCHKSELREDTHSVTIFDDPRWAATLEKIDATKCTTCHKEHKVAYSGVSIRQDFCFSCHDDVVTKRASHKNLEPKSCWNAGCHNYHDNTALNISFLKNRIGDSKSNFQVLDRAIKPIYGNPNPTPDYTIESKISSEIIVKWEKSLHAVRNVNCLDCHSAENGSFNISTDEKVCSRCHNFEVQTFFEGKHGVRNSLGLYPLNPVEARLPMKRKSIEDRKLTCSTCHDVHSVNTYIAAVDACLGCHNDTHSQLFLNSKHYTLFASEKNERSSSKAVSCATCHLPRLLIDVDKEARVVVNHNNTFTLRPRDRMVKEVCLNCHGLEFSMSSIFDDSLIKNNFQGKPGKRHETINMTLASQQ